MFFCHTPIESVYGILTQNQADVGQYTSPMDGMGKVLFYFAHLNPEAQTFVYPFDVLFPGYSKQGELVTWRMRGEWGCRR